MLVSFHKGFVMEGEALLEERKHFWSKKELKREKIYCYSGIGGICDMSDLSTEVEKQIKKRLASDGWGDTFLGWQRILNYEESLEIAKELEWDIDDLPKCKLTTETLDNWTVEHAAKTLNGKLFAQYCRDYGIVLTERDI
jgi:hypothetical protein